MICTLPTNILAIKSRRMRNAWHVACIGERNCAYRGMVGKLRERGHLEEMGVDGTII
jgi:hypothetical protein